MWPWEHAAVGYVLYSLLSRVTAREPPGDLPTVAVLIGTQLPDLVDKPLSWGLGVFQTGYAAGHSVLLAVPVGIAIAALSIRARKQAIGAGLVVGYWSHVVGDFLNPLRYGDGPSFDAVLWPVIVAPAYEQDLGLGRGLLYFGDLFASLQSVDSLSVLVAYFFVPLVAATVWLVDGAPGVAIVGRLGRQLQPE